MSFSLAITTAEEIVVTERAALLTDLANIRWKHEVGGLTLPGGVEVRSDRETRAALTEAVNSLSNGLMQAPIAWKMAAGWTDLSQQDLEAITAAVSAHVQASFAAERTVQAQIEAQDDLTDFDLQTAFEEALAAAYQ
ncbi:MAG: DUF4376 domain-containing protein [Pseudophaeobacter sp.]|jgi:hypothetical protein|uniref:DUF4376 domain-containing protein n=1 Tax=Pseudophaeobacter sp. TaxID=1971739 RepID=UPI0032D944B3